MILPFVAVDTEIKILKTKRQVSALYICIQNEASEEKMPTTFTSEIKLSTSPATFGEISPYIMSIFSSYK